MVDSTDSLNQQQHCLRHLSLDELRNKKLMKSTLTGFGSTQNTAFGAKPSGFGATPTTSGTSLFGGTQATSGSSAFGGFGASNPSSQTTAFGGSSNSGGLFGQAKPQTGFGTSAPSNPFGSSSATTGFGQSAGFGAPASSALALSTGECQGTGSVPFQATVEKEPNSTTNQQNSFQSICFQAPYQKFSPEELRLADYAAGRRYGNASNQPGAFGNTSFGGFGQNQTQSSFGASPSGTNTGLFGTASASPFGGTSQPATSGFGGTNTASSGGLFGQKPAATGGLFGTTTPSQPSTNLFGGGSSSGFGGNTTAFGSNNTNTGTSLFGSGNTASKPTTFGGFGTPAASGTAFGGAAPATGSGGLFGSNNQQQNTTNPFGAQQQQQQPATTSLFGGGSSFGTPQQNTGTTSLFGQSKPATPSLFGGTQASTGTGLFGGAAQPAANTNPFGGAANTQNTGGLFGAKPTTTTGTGLFGQSNTQQNTGGSSLFGGFGNQPQNQNQPQTSSLFGGLGNTNNQQKSSLFPQTQQQQGTSLFGTPNQQQGNSLFGGSLLGNNQQQQQQPQQTSSLFGGNNSLLGNSQQQQQQGFTASLSDATAFGGTSLFASLNGPPVSNPGPLATPLSSSVTRRKSAALPMYKLQPSSASRLTTPTRRGFGFSYSNYNSPGSASSTASTPGNFTNSLLGSTLGRGLSKSMSTSSLRHTFNTEDSILAPGAFSASPSARHYGSTGSLKKLVINRGIRGDLFNPPNPSSQSSSSSNGSILKKRVSFDSGPTPSQNGITSSPLKQTQSNASPSSVDGDNFNGTSSPPEMEQVRGNELALARVQEEDSPAPVAPSQEPAKPAQKPGEQLQEGQYYMKPTKAEIENMNRVQRQKVTGLTVGRVGYGEVTFDAPVDLTTINLDELVGKVIVIETRSLTVYPNTYQKPPMGKGLNVPSTVTLAQSWPRKKNNSRENIAKHIANLKKVPDTKFVNYEVETGKWTFKVDHYTTYEMYDDEDGMDGDDTNQFGESTLSAPPDTPTPKSRTPKSQQFDHSFATSEATQTESDPEDTFQFRKKKSLPLPGAFDDVYADEDMGDNYDEEDQQSFLDERSVGSQSENGVEEPMDQDDVFEDGESVSIVDQEMAGSFPQADNTAELGEENSQDEDGMDMVMDTPGAIVRARMRAAKNSGTPIKSRFAAGNDWTSTLKTTISPQKQDRALLKSRVELQGNEFPADAEPIPVAPRNRVVSDGRGFATSIDLMNSLFGQTRSPVKAKVPVKAKGFEVGAPSCL
jgi:nuclear pore complex protein Nup98-Nup96